MIGRSSEGERLVVVGSRPELLRMVAQRYGQADVVGCRSFLQAIAEASARPARVVLACAEAAAWRLPQAVRALRTLRADTRIVLCCEPAWEPLASQAGADDYVIYPPPPEELDQALQMPPTDTRALVRPMPAPPPTPTATELLGLADVLADLEEPPGHLLPRLADLVRQALQSEAVVIRTSDAIGQAGSFLAEPVLLEPIEQAGQVLGQIELGKAAGGYRAEHADRLRHYARLIGSILHSAQRQRQWREEALTDELTGLSNRRHVMRALPELLTRAARDRFRVTLVLFDLDDLKHYNDEFGHAVGDELIRETARLFRRHCRKHDIVARYGGDEFCVVFWDAEQPRVAGSKHPANALDVLKRFRQALQRHEFPALGPGGRGQLTISGGLASFPWDATQAEQLLEQADQGLRQAKAAGKNRIYLVGGTDSSGVQDSEDRASPTGASE
jgi:diguanylate cyclase (GGDEF)-like protein